ncbi:MAG: DUF2207 family protein [Candidatus Bathyarchaeia archaeon]
MSERREILTLVGITLVVGVAAIAFLGFIPSIGFGDAYVESYRAIFYENGTLIEEYTYRLKSGGNRFLYRVWDAPLSTQNPGMPYIEPIKIEPVLGAIGYSKDLNGRVQIWGESSDNRKSLSEISSLAERNEVGSFNPKTYEPGSYSTRLIFRVHPPVEYDDEYAHLNIKLADRHISYKNVEIVLKDAGYIEKAYGHPPSLRIQERGGDITLTGSSGENELIEVELLMETGVLASIDGFPTEVEDVRSKTVNANNIVYMQHYALLGLFYGSKALALIMPILLYAIYHIYGREKEYTVPRYLSTIPNSDRKPWVVNQIFEDTALDYDDDGFYATLLDLHLRGKIEIETGEGKIRIRINDTVSEDRYERRVMGLLETLSEDGVVDSNSINELTKRINEGEAEVGSKARRAKQELIELTTYVDQEVADEFIVRGKRRVLPLIALSVLAFLASMFLLINIPFEKGLAANATLTFLVPILQSGSALAFPSTLFGRWKGEAYKEKLEWDAFARHLDDFSRLREYAPEDIIIWGKWLVYGTALGVGESVARTMRELDIDLPAARAVSIMPIYFHPLVVASAPSRGRVSGSSSGGGGGFGGGGFGGGGAGVR